MAAWSTTRLKPWILATMSDSGWVYPSQSSFPLGTPGARAWHWQTQHAAFGDAGQPTPSRQPIPSRAAPKRTGRSGRASHARSARRAAAPECRDGVDILPGRVSVYAKPRVRCCTMVDGHPSPHPSRGAQHRRSTSRGCPTGDGHGDTAAASKRSPGTASQDAQPRNGHGGTWRVAGGDVLYLPVPRDFRHGICHAATHWVPGVVFAGAENAMFSHVPLARSSANRGTKRTQLEWCKRVGWFVIRTRSWNPSPGTCTLCNYTT